MTSYDVSQVFGGAPDYLDHCDATTFTCETLRPPCNSTYGLNFTSLWDITASYFSICGKEGVWLSNSTKDSRTAALSWDATHDIVPQGFTPFPDADIWSRISTWKLPLIQLIAVVPKPPLGIFVQVLTVMHLISDPIGSMQDLLHRLESYRNEVVHWRRWIDRHHHVHIDEYEDGKERRKERKEFSRIFAMIVESYKEIDPALSEEVREVLERLFPGQRLLRTGPAQGPERKQLLKECRITAGALAADRATSWLPVAVAELIFIAVFFINTLRLRTSEQGGQSATKFVNIELHSVAFSTLFFWLIPTVLAAAPLGASRTKMAIPSILLRFERDIMVISPSDTQFVMPSLDTSNTALKQRWLNGINLWRPRPLVRSDILTILPWLPFGFAIATGTLMSYFVPPQGWRCRTWGELYFAIGWAISYLLTFAISRLPSSLWTPTDTWLRDRTWLPSGFAFYIMLFKDLLGCVAVIVWIAYTQMGFYNRRHCYGTETIGLILPEQPQAYKEAQDGLRVGGVFLTILVLGIVIQGILILFILIRYAAAIGALLQDDTSVSGLTSAARNLKIANPQRQSQSAASGPIVATVRATSEGEGASGFELSQIIPVPRTSSWI